MNDKLENLLAIAFQRAIDYGMAVAISTRGDVPQSEYLKNMGLNAFVEYQRSKNDVLVAIKEELNLCLQGTN
jgi:imidazolonepropionase-like amidohydrolase